MAERFVRLILVLALAAGCSVRPPEQPPFGVPPGDPLLDSPAHSLWSSAVTARERNDLAAADRYLERALTLAPESSWLYRELAELRLRQGDAAAAEGLAQKALRHASRDQPGYQSALWRLVATARARRGDETGAERARLEAEMLWRRESRR